MKSLAGPWGGDACCWQSFQSAEAQTQTPWLGKVPKASRQEPLETSFLGFHWAKLVPSSRAQSIVHGQPCLKAVLTFLPRERTPGFAATMPSVDNQKLHTGPGAFSERTSESSTPINSSATLRKLQEAFNGYLDTIFKG